MFKNHFFIIHVRFFNFFSIFFYEINAQYIKAFFFYFFFFYYFLVIIDDWLVVDGCAISFSDQVSDQFECKNQSRNNKKTKEIKKKEN